MFVISVLGKLLPGIKLSTAISNAQNIVTLFLPKYKV